MSVKKASLPALARLEGKFSPNAETGCFDWNRSRSTQGRYPTVGGARGKCLYAYRVAFESVHGPIPKGPCPDGSDRYEVHHLCLNNTCVNPAHMVLLSRRQHIQAHKQLRVMKKSLAPKPAPLPMPAAPAAGALMQQEAA